jgi:hypothetical protein
MSDLLLVHNWNHLLKEGGIPPRIMEVPVEPHNAPFLVSGREDGDHAVVWVSRAGRNGRIRVCPRKDPTVRTSIITEIVSAGEQKNLGNIHALTKKGVAAAQAFLASFGFEKLEALVAEDVKDTFLPKTVSVYEKEWVPPGHLVLLPEDRSFVGDIGEMSTGHVMVVVHNPLRGMAIAK